MTSSENLPALDHPVSVVIPTKNAGEEFRLLLEKLKTQKNVKPPEIVIVDSGSTDATVETAHKYECKVIEIPPQSFTHSYARNLGAEAAGGEFLLFMVQDALPAGEDWLYRLLKFLLDNADKRVAAVSCVEFPRSDSDLIYNYQIRSHYKFLECWEQDKIMEWRGEDYLSLRQNGQLSNAACLIKKDIFDKYKFEGTYAEDLTLGIKLISEGYRLGLLSSVKVIHSHNRPPYYYLKRAFIDVNFMLDNFSDFYYLELTEPAALFSLIDCLFGITGNISQQVSTLKHDITVKELFDLVLTNIRLRKVSAVNLRISDQELLMFLDFLHEHKNGYMNDETVINYILSNLSSMLSYLEYVYPSLDKYLLEEFDNLLWKQAADAAGLYLAYLAKTCRDRKLHTDLMDKIESKLRAGV